MHTSVVVVAFSVLCTVILKYSLLIAWVTSMKVILYSYVVQSRKWNLL